MRRFVRGDTVESRVFCRCELCRLSFGRLRYPKGGMQPIGFGWKRDYLSLSQQLRLAQKLWRPLGKVKLRR